jgi:hypothetical protein
VNPTTPLNPDDVLADVRALLFAASAAGTGYPQTPQGDAFTRSRWVLRVLEALYDQTKFYVGFQDEHESLGLVLNAAHEHEERMRNRMWPEMAEEAEPGQPSQ